MSAPNSHQILEKTEPPRGVKQVKPPIRPKPVLPPRPKEISASGTENKSPLLSPTCAPISPTTDIPSALKISQLTGPQPYGTRRTSLKRWSSSVGEDPENNVLSPVENRSPEVPAKMTAPPPLSAPVRPLQSGPSWKGKSPFMLTTRGWGEQRMSLSRDHNDSESSSQKTSVPSKDTDVPKRETATTEEGSRSPIRIIPEEEPVTHVQDFIARLETLSPRSEDVPVVSPGFGSSRSAQTRDYQKAPIQSYPQASRYDHKEDLLVPSIGSTVEKKAPSVPVRRSAHAPKSQTEEENVQNAIVHDHKIPEVAPRPGHGLLSGDLIVKPQEPQNVEDATPQKYTHHTDTAHEQPPHHDKSQDKQVTPRPPPPKPKERKKPSVQFVVPKTEDQDGGQTWMDWTASKPEERETKEPGHKEDVRGQDREEKPCLHRQKKTEEEEEPSTVREEPSTGREETSTGREEPSTRREEPSTGREEPSTGREETYAEREAPSTGREEPSTGREEPSTGRKEPSTGREEPSTGREEPSKGREEPSTGREEPSKGREEPSKGREEPSKGREEPSTGREEPPPLLRTHIVDHTMTTDDGICRDNTDDGQSDVQGSSFHHKDIKVAEEAEETRPAPHTVDLYENVEFGAQSVDTVQPEDMEDSRFDKRWTEVEPGVKSVGYVPHRSHTPSDSPPAPRSEFGYGADPAPDSGTPYIHHHESRAHYSQFHGTSDREEPENMSAESDDKLPSLEIYTHSEEFHPPRAPAEPQEVLTHKNHEQKSSRPPGDYEDSESMELSDRREHNDGVQYYNTYSQDGEKLRHGGHESEERQLSHSHLEEPLHEHPQSEYLVHTHAPSEELIHTNVQSEEPMQIYSHSGQESHKYEASDEAIYGYDEPEKLLYTHHTQPEETDHQNIEVHEETHRDVLLQKARYGHDEPLKLAHTYRYQEEPDQHNIQSEEETHRNVGLKKARYEHEEPEKLFYSYRHPEEPDHQNIEAEEKSHRDVVLQTARYGYDEPVKFAHTYRYPEEPDQHNVQSEEETHRDVVLQKARYGHDEPEKLAHTYRHPEEPDQHNIETKEESHRNVVLQKARYGHDEPVKLAHTYSEEPDQHNVHSEELAHKHEPSKTPNLTYDQQEHRDYTYSELKESYSQDTKPKRPQEAYEHEEETFIKLSQPEDLPEVTTAHVKPDDSYYQHTQQERPHSRDYTSENIISSEKLSELPEYHQSPSKDPDYIHSQSERSYYYQQNQSEEQSHQKKHPEESHYQREQLEEPNYQQEHSEESHYHHKHSDEIHHRQEQSEVPDYQQEESEEEYYQQKHSEEPNYKPAHLEQPYYYQQDISNDPDYQRHQSKDPDYQQHQSKDPDYQQHQSDEQYYQQKHSEEPNYQSDQSERPYYHQQDQSADPNYQQHQSDEQYYQQKHLEESHHKHSDELHCQHAQSEVPDSRYAQPQPEYKEKSLEDSHLIMYRSEQEDVQTPERNIKMFGEDSHRLDHDYIDLHAVETDSGQVTSAEHDTAENRPKKYLEQQHRDSSPEESHHREDSTSVPYHKELLSKEEEKQDEPKTVDTHTEHHDVTDPIVTNGQYNSEESREVRAEDRLKKQSSTEGTINGHYEPEESEFGKDRSDRPKGSEEIDEENGEEIVSDTEDSPEEMKFDFLEGTTVLDTSLMRCRASLGRKRNHRTPATGICSAEEEADPEYWMYRDSTEPKPPPEKEPEDEKEVRSPESPPESSPTSVKSPKKGGIFSGIISPSLLKGRLKTRSKTEDETSKTESKETNPDPTSPGKEKSESSSHSLNWLQALKKKKKKHQK